MAARKLKLSDNLPFEVPVTEAPAKKQSDPLQYEGLARQYLQATQHRGHPTCHWWNGNWYVWRPDVPVYTQLPEKDFTLVLLNWMMGEGIHSDHGVAQKTQYCLQAMQRLDGVPTMPAWLGAVPNRHNWWLSTENRLVNPKALAEGGVPTAVDHTPLWFSTNRTEWQYDPRATCPLWLDFLQHSMAGDDSRIRLLQQFFGYWLVPDTSRQICLFLVGYEGTGKSTIVQMVRRLLGPTACSSLGLDSFVEGFSLETTMGKTLNVSDELGEWSRKAESQFKWFVGGSPMSFNRKHLPRIEATPTARLLVCVNQWPRIHDTTGAVYRRIKAIPMDVVVQEQDRDDTLWGKLADEAPGVFNWAVEGLRSLLQYGWVECPAGSRLMSGARAALQPHRGFVDRCIKPHAGGFVPSTVLGAAYRQYCRLMRDEGVLTAPPPDIRAVCREIEVRHPESRAVRKRHGGEQVRGILGIRLTGG